MSSTPTGIEPMDVDDDDENVSSYENSPKLLTRECVGDIITTADSRAKAADEPLERLSVMTSE